jgi:small conductance mechanosensitive channel
MDMTLAGLLSFLETSIGGKLLTAIAVLIIGVLLAKFAKRVLDESLSRIELDVTLQKFITKSAEYTIYALAVLIALSTIGLNILPVIAGIGVAGFIVGFAVKDTLSNLTAGLLLIFYRPFNVGDKINTSGVTGKVKEINIVATVLETEDANIVTVPNSKVWGAPITKFSK